MSAELIDVSPGVVRVTWTAELQARGLGESSSAVRHAVEQAFKGGSTRVETHVDPEDQMAQRIATFSGLMREGVARGVTDGQEDRIVYARLVLERCDGNKREACRVLDISYHTLQSYLRFPVHDASPATEPGSSSWSSPPPPALRRWCW